MRIPLKLFYKYKAIFFNSSPTSSHFHPLQVENCVSNSRLVVDEMTIVNSGSKGLTAVIHISRRMKISSKTSRTRMEDINFVQYISFKINCI